LAWALSTWAIAAVSLKIKVKLSGKVVTMLNVIGCMCLMVGIPLVGRSGRLAIPIVGGEKIRG